jgi:Bardet-Biedl syndrome 9 protein
LKAFSEGNVSHGNQYTLKFAYDHVLQRTAFNMCKGSFGGITSSSAEAHEYICVQSMDGMLSIFEYESFSISCFLPKVLLPGPFKYVPKTDSFVTVSSSWELESYKYQTLATSAKSFERNAGEGTGTKLKRLLPEYTYNLGEAALDMDVVTQSNGQCYIMVLGERNLYCLSETCVLKYMKKFDFNPSAFCVYPVLGPSASPDSLSFIVSTHAKVLFVHQDVRTKWAAQVDHVPVQIAVAKINDMKGIIVTLSEDGKLKCSYLGTEPAMLNPLVKDDMSKSFNYKTAEEDYRALQGQIKNAIINSGSVMAQGGANKSGLQMSIEVPQRLDPTHGFNRQKETELSDPIDVIPSVTCKLTLRSGLETVQNVKVNFESDLIKLRL